MTILQLLRWLLWRLLIVCNVACVIFTIMAVAAKMLGIISVVYN